MDLEEINLLSKAGEHKKVIDALQPMVNDNSLPFNMKMILLESYFQQGSFNNCLQLINAIFSSKLDLVIQFQLKNYSAESFIKLGKITEATEAIHFIYSQAKKEHYEEILKAKILEAKICEISDNVTDGINVLEDAITLYNLPTNNNLRIKIFGNLGVFYGDSGNHRKAIVNFKEVLKIAQDLGDKRQMFRTYVNLSIAYASLEEHDRAYDYNSKAMRIAIETNDDYNLMIAFMELGNLDFDTGNLIQSKENLEKALELSEKLNISYYSCLISTNLVHTMTILGDYSKAEEILNSKKDQIFNIKHNNLMVNYFKNYSYLKAKYGDINESIDAMKKAIQIQEQTKLDIDLLEQYVTIIDWLLFGDNIVEAQKYYDKLLNLIQKDGGIEKKKWHLLAKSSIDSAKADLGIARNLLIEFLEHVGDKNLKKHQIRGCLRLANVLLKISLFQNSESLQNEIVFYISKSIKLSKEINDFESIMESSLTQVNISITKGFYDNAREILEEILELSEQKKSAKYSERIERWIGEVETIRNTKRKPFALLQSEIVRSTIQIIKNSLAYIDPLAEKNDLFINCLCYMLDEFGPKVVFSDKPIDEEFSLKTGAFFFTALGQGSFFREGLFGPLPFGSENIALLYSKFVPDSRINEIDPRFNGKNYIVLAFELKMGTSHLIDQNSISALLNNNLSSITDIRSVSKPFWSELVIKLKKMN